jgi:menaquinone-dependent protoporphyrinogen oxidase
MCELPVFYATTEGQTRRIAERLAGRLRDHGFDARAIEIGSTDCDGLEWSQVRGAVVGASLHMQAHQPKAVSFARAHAADLARLPSLFVSVSLSVASKNKREVDAARQCADGFATTTGWRPNRIACVAGRLAYTQYGWLTRALMRRIARKEGASTDTSTDHEYTDWTQVRDVADAFAADIRRHEAVAERLGAAASRERAGQDVSAA